MIEIKGFFELQDNPYLPEEEETGDWRHFLVTLSSESAEMTLYFSLSWGEFPTAEDITEHLQDLSAGMEHITSVEEWAEEYGFALSPVVEQKYGKARSIVSDYHRLRFLG